MLLLPLLTEEGNAILYLCEALFYRLLFQGIVQPIAALFAALVVLPFASAMIILCKYFFFCVCV